MQINNTYYTSYIAPVKRDRQNIAGERERSFSDVVAAKTAETDSNKVHKKPRLFWIQLVLRRRMQ